jgi:oligopeptide transport system permease protein
MLNFILPKVLRVLLVLTLVEFIVFLLVHAIPGNPWDAPTNQIKAMSNVYVDQAALETRSRYFGFDLPLWRQFTRYMIGDIQEDEKFVCGVVCGNLGPSTRQIGRSVQDILFQQTGKSPWDSRVGYTFRLVAWSFGIVSLLGIPIGVTSAFWSKSLFDRFVSTLFTSAAAIPTFVLGLLGILIFASALKWVKVIADWSNPKDWVLPVILLSIVPLSNVVRLTRATVLNEMQGDYIRTARAKGRTRAETMWRHILPNALLSILTFLFPVFVELIAASFIIEGTFAFPGFGREYWDSIGHLDYAMIMGITFIYASSITLANLFLEVIRWMVDPRVQRAV